MQGGVEQCRVVQSCAGLCRVVQNSTSHMCRHNLRIDFNVLIIKLMPRPNATPSKVAKTLWCLPLVYQNAWFAKTQSNALQIIKPWWEMHLFQESSGFGAGQGQRRVKWGAWVGGGCVAGTLS